MTDEAKTPSYEKYSLAQASLTLYCHRWTFCETSLVFIQRDEGDNRIWNIVVYKDLDQEFLDLAAQEVDIVISGDGMINGEKIALRGTINRSYMNGKLHWMTGFVTNFDVQGELEIQETEPIRRIRFSKRRL